MHKSYLGLLLVIFSVFGHYSCGEETSEQLFKKLNPEHTNILFNNSINESDSLSILNYEYIYNGGGVALVDVNNDELLDIFFTGNMVPNAIYLNRGSLKFEDVSDASGVGNLKRWSSGVSAIDINNDGWMDFYVCATGHKGIKNKRNLLLVNKGPNASGIPQFDDMADEYGLADSSNSTNAVFFDYDNDGDLDLYLLTNEMVNDRRPSNYIRKIEDGSSPRTDKLYENLWDDTLGHSVFTDVSRKAGILKEGYGLGVNITDFNKDGWKDIYVTNDYLSNDLLYINNKDKTFSEKADIYFKHTSFSAMGNDVIDLDNDGFEEVIALDMLPEDNFRKKTMFPPLRYNSYLNNEKYGYQYQYVRNTLQKNQFSSYLVDTGFIFQEVSMYSGIAATDWSWTPSVADFDCDGDRDLLVTNGFPRDITDIDFIDFSSGVSLYASDEMLLSKMPSVKIPNYAYRNEGDLKFQDVTSEWGLDEPGFSNGAAYGDLDMDGDLDWVVNNINSPASIYENLANKKDRFNWVKIKFTGSKENFYGIGSQVLVYDDGQLQYCEFTPYRGYLSTVDYNLHFGFADSTLIDSIVIIGPDNTLFKRFNVQKNQVVEIDLNRGGLPRGNKRDGELKPLLAPIDLKKGLNYTHVESDYIDFNVQPLLLRKMSQFGPGMAVSDLNGDGLEDLYVSGSHFNSGKFFIQQMDGSFSMEDLNKTGDDPKTSGEELGVLFFDADSDGDKDMYVAHGGYEFAADNDVYVDRFYENVNGSFHWRPGSIPSSKNSNMTVRASDFDRDGDLDLFVGTRMQPEAYPLSPHSKIMVNRSTPGKILFEDMTSKLIDDLSRLELISDALWTDYDDDGWIDLILAGEWAPIVFLRNDKGLKFIDQTSSNDFSSKLGWWNSISPADYDLDGDIDYVVGNFGINTLVPVSESRPMNLYFADFDKNGTLDALPFCYLKDPKGTYREYPYFGRVEVQKQINHIRGTYARHEEFALVTKNEFFTKEEAELAQVKTANFMKSIYVENLGGGRFDWRELPLDLQLSPLNGMLGTDINFDGIPDLLIVGNDYGIELTSGRADAFNGAVALGDGRGNFNVLNPDESGFYVPGDGKSLVSIFSNKKPIFIASQNRGPLVGYSSDFSGAMIDVQDNDLYAIITNQKGDQYKREFYYGTSYISQSSRNFVVSPEIVKRVEIFTIRGLDRTIEL